MGKVKLALKHNDLALAKRSVGETFANLEESYSHKGVKDYIKVILMGLGGGYFSCTQKRATNAQELSKCFNCDSNNLTF